MLQMNLHLTRSSRLWTFQLLGFEVFQENFSSITCNILARNRLAMVANSSK
jgi:hypothetical protein